MTLNEDNLAPLLSLAVNQIFSLTSQVAGDPYQTFNSSAQFGALILGCICDSKTAILSPLLELISIQHKHFKCLSGSVRSLHQGKNGNLHGENSSPAIGTHLPLPCLSLEFCPAQSTANRYICPSTRLRSISAAAAAVCCWTQLAPPNRYQSSSAGRRASTPRRTRSWWCNCNLKSGRRKERDIMSLIRLNPLIGLESCVVS